MSMTRMMIRDPIEERGVTDPRVLEAMQAVPRHLFVPEALRDVAYGDHPLPIGHGQTISQPYIVAVMTELLDPRPEDTVLEIGTGSGYQAAVLATLVRHVYTIEIVEPLAESARKRLAELGYDNVTVITGDGHRGHPEKSPYDGIIVTAAPERVPQPLLDQLRVGAKLVIPVGAYLQDLEVIERSDSGYETRSVLAVRFVPMTRSGGDDALGSQAPSASKRLEDEGGES
jgi:protein-L-isoaspartate(D-aspartate) O-methyltransferase